MVSFWETKIYIPSHHSVDKIRDLAAFVEELHDQLVEKTTGENPQKEQQNASNHNTRS